jgi:hypothetical protein
VQGGTAELVVERTGEMGGWLVTAYGLYVMREPKDGGSEIVSIGLATKAARTIPAALGHTGYGMSLPTDGKPPLHWLVDPGRSDLMLIEGFR